MRDGYTGINVWIERGLGGLSGIYSKNKYSVNSMLDFKVEDKDCVKIVAVDLQAMAPLPGVIQIQVRHYFYFYVLVNYIYFLPKYFH